MEAVQPEGNSLAIIMRAELSLLRFVVYSSGSSPMSTTTLCTTIFANSVYA